MGNLFRSKHKRIFEFNPYSDKAARRTKCIIHITAQYSRKNYKATAWRKKYCIIERPENILIFSFLVMSVWGRSKITTWKRKLFKNLFRKISFRQVPAYLENFFQLRKHIFFASGLKIHEFYWFSYSQLGRHQTWQFDNKKFSKNDFLQW